MTRYIIRRAIQSLVIMWMTTLISFAIYQAAPGGPIQFIDNDPSGSQDYIIRLERLYGLDRSIGIQYITWLAGEDWAASFPNREQWQSGRCIAKPDKCGLGIARLDFGRSFHYRGSSVLSLIIERIPATLLLAGSSLILSVVIGIPLGIIAALTRGRWPDHTIRLTTVMLNTVPDWWIGLLMLIFLGGYLKLVPLSGMQTIGDGSFLDRLHHLILPATIGATGGWIGFSRIMRFEMLDVLNQDYVRTAKSKGLSQYAVITRHVLRNAMMPFVTGLSGIFLLILAGSILFEIVFSWPGMGRLAITAINSRDYPVIMAFFVISSFLSILGLLLVDILYSVVDPRVTYTQEG